MVPILKYSDFNMYKVLRITTLYTIASIITISIICVKILFSIPKKQGTSSFLKCLLYLKGKPRDFSFTGPIHK